MRFGCLDGPRPGISSLFIDFIGFHRFSLILEASKARRSNALWPPVATVWTPLYIDFSILEASCLLDDECKIDGSGAGAWRLLDDEWKTDWKEFSHARA